MLVLIAQVNDTIGVQVLFIIFMNTFVDRDECLDSPCDGNATCQNTPGSFVCTCNEGFTGSGLECQGMVYTHLKI